MAELPAGRATAGHPFAGKWTLAAVDGKYVTLEDAANGCIALHRADRPVAAQYLNAYGDEGDELWLQASNWRYLAWSGAGTGYRANQPRDAEPAIFALEPADGNRYRILHQDGGKSYYLNADGDQLGCIPKTEDPPATTVFTRQSVSPGLQKIRATGLAINTDLSGAYLAGEDLRNITFSASDLSGAVLRGAELRGAVLQGCIVDGTDFSTCQLADVTLTGVAGTAPLFEGVTVFNSTVMSGARIDGASFRDARQQGKAKLNGITAREAVFNGADLTGVVLNGADLSQAQLIGVNLSGAQMGQTKFVEATMTLVNLRGTAIQNSDFSRATLVGADFTGADLTAAHFPEAALTNAKFSAANGITDIDVTGASLVGAMLEELDLRSVKIDRNTDFTRARMRGVDLREHNLDGVTLLESDLRQSKLDHTSCEDAILVGADLSFASVTGNVSFVGANISNASLEGADLSGAQMGPKTTLLCTLSPQAATQLDDGTVPWELARRLGLTATADAEPRITVRRPGAEWLVEHGEHCLFVNRNEAATELTVSRTDNAAGAIMANVFMPNAILTGANLYAVDMSGVQWFGANARADNANLEQANLANANLATMNLTQARMYGANLAFANLVNTNFQKAMLGPTRGLKPSSLAFASLQGADFADAQLDSANLTNAAVSLEIHSPDSTMHGVPLFRIPSSLGPNLDQGQIPDDLIKAFREQGYGIRQADCLTVHRLSSLWLLRTTTDSDYQQFILLGQVGQDIQVFGDTSAGGTTPIQLGDFRAVPLFQASASLAPDLDRGSLSQDLQTAFSDNGYPLIANACITVTAQSRRWMINNREADPASLQKGYSQFSLLKRPFAGNEVLQIYGASPLLVVRRLPDNTLARVPVAFGPTTFGDNVLTADTTCPSGLKFGLLEHGISYESLMTPGLPPKPPACIPSPTTWCSPV